MQYKYKYLMVILSIFILSIPGLSLVTAQDMDDQNLFFVNHILAGMAEADVYMATDDGMVMRVPGDAPIASIGQPLYAAAEAQEHDPFALGDNPLGPFEMGAELGITLGDWLKAEGHGSYTLDGDMAQIELTLHNLVPNGVYTAWCSIVTVPPEHTITDTACGVGDGSDNMFVADDNGDVAFSVTTPALPPTTDASMSMVALAYHSDGNTYGAHPGDFGLNSHVHVFAVIPPME